MRIRNDHDLVQQVLDGEISPKGFKAFQDRLRREPKLVALYREYAILHHTIYEELEAQPVASLPLQVVRSKRMPVWAGLAAAAVVALLAVVLLRGGGRRAMAQAEVAFSEDAVWHVTGSYQAAGDKVTIKSGAVVRLQQGQARLNLGGGATAVIDGDTEMEFVTGQALRLGHGRGWFRVDTHGRKLEVATAAVTAVDLGTEFGMVSRPGKPDEIHVLDGRVQLRLPEQEKGPVLAAGEAARVADRKTIERMPATMARIPQAAPQFTRVFEERFDQGGDSGKGLNGRVPLVGKGKWLLKTGKPVIAAGRLEGGDFTAFCKLPINFPTKEQPVLLATLEAVEPAKGSFHTADWSGISLMKGCKELLFFGDCFGDDKTWSLDVKQGQRIVLPKEPVAAPRTVTLCYNRDTGVASLHEGALPLGPAFVTGRVPAGTEFDEIRIGAAKGAVLAIRSITLRTGGMAAK